MEPKLVLLNGPARSGKDFAWALIAGAVAEGRSVAIRKFARIVKEATHAAHGLVDWKGAPRPHAYYEPVKDERTTEFFGKTPREAYIAFSETFMKPLHGKAIFGQLLLREIGSNQPNVTVVTDSGFTEEAAVLVRYFGVGNCFLVRLRREGLSFAGDSRGYIDLPDVMTLDVTNPGDPEGFLRELGPVLDWIS